MGNILCRDKTPRRVYVKGPVKGTDKVFDPQLFSNDSLVNGTRKDTPSTHHSNYNNKMFFSTPNLNNDMKSTISLDARIFDRGNSKNPPVAPPRKKRTTLKKGSTLPTTLPSDAVRNGFKDVFGNSSNSSSNIDGLDYIDKDENSLQDRSMINQRTSTPGKKLKIGNKKSDKFFGESLSDHLSDEPVTPISKEDEHSPDDSKTITDKKLSFFLMNMLDDIRNAEDEEKYKGQVPIDEPPFIARRRETKHICDDDDHIHCNIHKKEKESEQAPPKPDRDFSKFKLVTQETIPNIDDEAPTAEKVEIVQAKVHVRRGISRENLPSPPAAPHRKKGVTSLPNTPTITIETIDASIEKYIATNENLMPNEETKELTKETQNNGNITEQLVDEVIKKAYGMSDFNYHPEDFSHHTYDDGSNLVTPTSKLAVRKISASRKISTESAPSLDNEMLNVKVNDTSLPKTSQIDSTQVCEKDVNLNEMQEEIDSKFHEIDEGANIPKSPIAHKSSEVLSGSTVNDIIDEIYNKNSDIMKEFQSFLEQSIEKEPIINVDEEKKFLDLKTSIGEQVDDEFDNHSYSDSFESSDDEDEIKVANITNTSVGGSVNSGKRRESIEDVENWFSHHIELDQKESDVCNSLVGEPRLSIGYDTNKIFPFGSTITGRRDSQSDEFFVDTLNINQRTKVHIESVRESESSILEEDEDETKEKGHKNRSKESSPDHSTLLKFLDKTNNAETNKNN